MSNKLADFFEAHYTSCSLKTAIGVDCPGCGMQRSIHALLQGNVSESFYFYPALFSLIFMFGFLVLHLVFNFKKGAKILIILFAINAAIILLNFIYKLLPLFF